MKKTHEKHVSKWPVKSLRYKMKTLFKEAVQVTKKIYQYQGLSEPYIFILSVLLMLKNLKPVHMS